MAAHPAANVTVALRFVLSGSKRTLSVIQQAPEGREPGTPALVFSMPDANGLVHISTPAGTLLPGSEILIINTTNGVVVTLTASDSGVQGEILATINDRLLVTITDPDDRAASHR